MKLYGDTLSPFVRMCLVTAHEVGLGTKIQREISRVDPTTVNAGLAAVSPVGKVPVLVTDHNHAIYDSRVIIEYLCHVSGNKTLIPDDGVKRFRVLTVAALGQAIAEAGVAWRYETAVRPQGLQWHYPFQPSFPASRAHINNGKRVCHRSCFVYRSISMY